MALSYPRPSTSFTRDPLPWSEVLLFLDIKDMRNVRLTSIEKNREVMCVLKLKYMERESVELSCVHGMDDRLKFLVENGILKSQKELILDACCADGNVTAEGVAHLARLNVEAVSLRRVPSIANDFLDYLAEMTSLKSVTISGVHAIYSRTQLSIPYATRVLNHLETFSVKHIKDPLEIDDFVHLGGMSSLKSLTLSPCIPGNSLNHLVSCLGERLESLDVEFFEFSNDGARAIASMKSLRSLRLCRIFHAPVNHVVVFDFSVLAGLENLVKLEIRFPIGDHFLFHVGRSMHSLRYLALGNCELISDGSLRHLGPLHALETLKMCDFYGLTGMGLAHLHRMASLKTLALAWCNRLVDDDIRELIRNVASLRRMYIWDCANICIKGTARDGLDRPGAVIKIDDEFSRDDVKIWT